MISSIFVGFGSGYVSEPSEWIPQPEVIKVGVVYSNKVLGFGGCNKDQFSKELDNYSWSAGKYNYSFFLCQIDNTVNLTWPYYQSDLVHYDRLKNYNVIIIAGIQDEQILGGIPVFKELAAMKIIKENLERFVREGHGFIGHCAGSTMVMGVTHEPRTIDEAIEKNYNFINSDINMITYTGIPILAEYCNFNDLHLLNWLNRINYPEYVSAISNFMYAKNPQYGIPMHLNIRDSDHPILRDCLDNTLFFRLSGGPAFVVPIDNLSISTLADYKWEEDPYLNSSTRFNAWSLKMNGLIPGLEEMRDLLTGDSSCETYEEFFSTYNSIFNSWGNLIDWDYTNIPIKTEHVNRTALAAFNYPYNDPNGGRIVVCTLHPELRTFARKGNFISPVEDNESNRWWFYNQSLIVWKNDSGTPDDPSDDRLIDYSDFIDDPNCWFVRRENAWASGEVPDDYLPPVYGRSQVIDINPILQESSVFTINCTVGKEKGEVWNTANLSLYYKYNGSNSSNQWTDWKYYDSDYVFPWRFQFNASNAMGYGQYQFYSNLNTTNATGYANESVPPGADAECIVGKSVAANFYYDPGSVYVNHIVYFLSTSFTPKNTYITQYNWDFGDGYGQYGSNCQNTTHTYTEDGMYTITLTVTNNISQNNVIKKNITVLNVPPIADFTRTNKIVFKRGETISFYDASNDPDGSIVKWNWDFGDRNSSTEQNPNHAYSRCGSYPVSLEVTDNDGMTASKCDVGYVIVVSIFVDQGLPADDPLNYTWTTIQKAIDNSSTFDFIYIKNGFYDEDVSIDKSLFLFGENQHNVIIDGSVLMSNPFDFELPDDKGYIDNSKNMSGNVLLMHFNNDFNVGENYSNSNLIYDYSGSKNNGTKCGATWITSTPKGAGAFDFNGINDSINLSSITALTKENVTIAAWIYWGGGDSTSDPILSQSNGINQGYLLYVNNTNDKPVFRLNNTEVTSSMTLNSGWHYLVGTHNHTKLKIYVDGSLAGTSSKTGQGKNTFAYIGFNNISNYFRGCIDEIAIWNRTLTDNEIYTIYSNNYGVYLRNVTLQNTNIAMTPTNHSEISDCIFIDNLVSVSVNSLMDVVIKNCNISNGNTGINITNCNTDYNDSIKIIDCEIENISNGIIVNTSSNISIIRVIFNCSNTNMSFTACNSSNIHVLDSYTSNNVAPDIPMLFGPSLGDPGKPYTYSARTNDSNDDQLLYLFDWGDGNDTGWIGFYWSNETVQSSNTWRDEGGYYVRVKTKDVFNNESAWNIILFRTETFNPIITSVQHTPDAVGFGYNVTITANVTDNESGVKLVKIKIDYPDGKESNTTMTHVTGNMYQYIFTDTLWIGQYNYSVWAQDNAYNNQSSVWHHFHVSANATMSVATLKDSYTGNEYINITDPPNPSENYTVVGHGLDWNNYYDAVTGQNVLEVFTRPINYLNETNDWTPINCTFQQLSADNPAYPYGYRIGNNRGLFGVYFKPNLQSDWPVAFTYNRTDDTTTSVIRSKLVGVGYVDPQSNWAYEYLQNAQSSLGQTNDNSITYPGVFTGTDATWRYGNTGLKEDITMSNVTKTVLQNHPPSQYGLNDASSYLVFITRLDYQNLDMYNASGKLTGNVTISDNGVDFKNALGQFKCALPLGEAYELNNNSIRQKLTYRIVHLNGDTYLLSGLKVSDLNAMTFPVVIDPTLTVDSLTNDGYIYKTNSNYNTAWTASTGTISSSDNYISIGQNKVASLPPDYRIYRGFVLFNTSSLPSNAVIDNAKLSLYKKDDYSTTDFAITIQNGQPAYPHNPLQTGDYAKSHYSGNGGSLNTMYFVNGRNDFGLTNLSWINRTGITKLCLRSSRDISGTTPTGSEYVNVYSADTMDSHGESYKPRLIITYRNQSKIKNTGSTDIKGYLLIQIQFYNTSQGVWVVDNDTINETSPRTIVSNSQLALDTIFNGLIHASDLTHGAGTYRVYAAFRDPEGKILRTDDGTELVTWWQFSKT